MAINDRRAELKARQRSGASAHALKSSASLPPSKALRAAAKTAFCKHVQPIKGELKFCSLDADWRSCILRQGNSERATAAKGCECSDARAALKWPNDLACIDPNRISPDVAWSKKFLEYQQSLGHAVGAATNEVNNKVHFLAIDMIHVVNNVQCKNASSKPLHKYCGLQCVCNC